MTVRLHVHNAGMRPVILSGSRSRLRSIPALAAAAVALAVLGWQPASDSNAFAVKFVKPEKPPPPMPPKAADIKSGGPDDLLIVGAGSLGRRIATEWKKLKKGGRIVGVTRTTDSHTKLFKSGVEPILEADLSQHKLTFPNVVFAVPPRDNNMAEDAKKALAYWKPEGKIGTFLLTSSTYVYTEDKGGTIDESAPVYKPPYPAKPNVEKRLGADQIVLDAGGTVLRMAGLYCAGRGPHKYWWRSGKVAASPDAMINLVHYDDASCAIATAVSKSTGPVQGGNIFLLDDGSPVRLDEMIKSVNTKEKAPVFETTPDGDAFWKGKGKILNTEKIRTKLQWKPKIVSFKDFQATLNTNNSPTK